MDPGLEVQALGIKGLHLRGRCSSWEGGEMRDSWSWYLRFWVQGCYGLGFQDSGLAGSRPSV